MKDSFTRRDFLKTTSVAGAGLLAMGTVRPTRAAESPNNRIRAAVMGVNGRGMNHVSSLLALPNCEIAYICDVDSRAIDKAINAVAKKQDRKPKGVTDFRQILDDKEIDVLTIATPNHWHAPASILACKAGKHVYVEKPCCHNPHEGELMVQAARKYNRKVQMGNQRRSWPWIIEAMQRLHSGEFGQVFFARAWYNNRRGPIGHGKPAPVPEWLDYSLWQGPAPERPFVDNLIHYNWHWRWHWGNGEIGNNGIHVLDLARWGLKVEYPKRVTCGGGRYHFQDDQETPDTYVTSFDFGDKGATFTGHSCDKHSPEGGMFGCTFYCEKGALVISDTTYRILDSNDKVVSEEKGQSGDHDHFGNFLDAIRDGKPLNSEIEEGYKSTLLCHLGNIAYRTGSTVDLDPASHKIAHNKDAMKLWSNEYRKGWEPKV
ncbi:Gfo/Idh/MocA family oxidoreductase [Pedosphaera parvula]|uniref:Oxidoreductase domain protein n=1 Tax=Pedosphaera parvula (strain Ellin514) TaxID=320771 RepID=B9XNP7_PEDPL|nr:Gfo/Idh/MocA family oxidoreductase [Pedosphaera parvula]EEF58587.1 oxidoreductase domain protein [Pedosphaera parvula Ellin514]